MKDLVLGMVKGYDFEQIRPFLSSLIETGYSGDVCLYYSNLSRSTLDALRERRVELIPFTIGRGGWLVGRMEYHRLVKRLFKSPLKWVLPLSRLYNGCMERLAARQGDGSFEAKCRIAAQVFGIFCIRHALYYLHLREHGAKYRHVMLTDVRDVLFQRNPFDFPIGDELCVFLEDERESIEECCTNSKWVRDAYGNEGLREIGKEPITCAGVTIGSCEAVMRYLELMVEHMLHAKSLPGTMDQGVHNYLIHKRLVKARLCRNGESSVLTMGKMTDLPTVFNEDGLLLNDDGSVPHVLHQYDRHLAPGKLALVDRPAGARLIAA